MANQVLADQLKQALDLWVELTGVDPNAKSFAINMGGGRDTYTVKKMHDAIKEALELDPTNITGHLLLDSLATQYFKDRTFSVDELIEHPERVAEYAAKAKAFRALAQSPEITDLSESFALTLRQALRHYGADSEEVMAVVADRHELAFLRRDALRSIEGLRVDQFLKGSAEPKGVAPLYNGIVHQFWNINSLVNEACRQPSGVTLNLVRDPDDFQSYFAFAIRNGGNLFVLSDVPVHKHPLQRYMSRRPDREFAGRAARNWFPYELLNIKYDEESKRLYSDRSASTALIPVQQHIDQLKPISDLQPQEIIWITMMFDLIVEQFWNKGHQAPSLSYTAQMIREETPLLESAQHSNLPVVGYQTLALPALAVSDVTHDKISEAAIGSDGGSPNRWLEDRYAHRVTNEVLNLLSVTGTKHYLPSLKTEHSAAKHHETALVSTNQVVSVSEKADERLPFWNKEGRYGLHALDVASFGTRAELESNRGFIARHNLAKGVQRLADEEFEARKDEIKTWWETAITKNITTIYGIASLPEVWRPLDTARFPQAKIRVGGSFRHNHYPLAKRWDEKEWQQSLGSGLGSTFLSQGYQRKGGKYLCHLNGTASTYRVVFQPQTAGDLAFMAGCEIEELPDVLQHWCRSDDHDGNHILARIDPMAWALTNPWQRMSFAVSLFLSIRGLKIIQKEYAPPPGLLDRPGSDSLAARASSTTGGPNRSGTQEG